MSHDAFSDNIVNAINGSILELFKHIEEDIEIDDDNFVCIDGEEGDYGVTRYIYKGECVMVEFNLGGDSIDYQYTKYAVDNIIQPKFNFKIDIRYLEDSSPDNCVAHFMVKRFYELKSQIGSLESVRSSQFLDESHKKEIEDVYNKYASFIGKTNP